MYVLIDCRGLSDEWVWLYMGWVGCYVEYFMLRIRNSYCAIASDLSKREIDSKGGVLVCMRGKVGAASICYIKPKVDSLDNKRRCRKLVYEAGQQL